MTGYDSLFKPDLRDFERLCDYLLREPNIRERDRITPKRLQEQYEKEMMSFHFNISCGCDFKHGHPLGCAVLWETSHPGWLENGTAWKHPSQRTPRAKRLRAPKGSPPPDLMADMLDELFETKAAQGKNIFAISSSLSYGDLVQERKFLRATLETLPHVEQWADSIGLPHRRIPTSAYRPLAASVIEGERQLYFRFAS